jgi:prophage tail gpP-like protein
VKIEIKGTGKKYTNFVSATTTIGIDNLSNTFSFSSGIGKKIDLDFGIGSDCVVSIENERVLTGHIEIINGRGSQDNNTIDVVGRDKTGDLVDSSIGALDDFKAPISLKTAIEKVIAHIGADIDVVDFVKAKFEESQDLLSPEAGDNAFGFIEKLARKKKAILSSNDEGNVVIQRNIGVSIDAHIINTINGNRNNVISYEFNYDHTGRFRKYLALGNSNLSLIDLILSRIGSKEIVDKQGFSLDTLSREGRQFVIASESPGTAPEQKQRTDWENNIRKSRSRTYKVKVHGFRNQTGEIWIPNTVVRVIDDNAKIDDRMLINTISYRMDLSEGKTCEISLVNKDSYTLEAAEPQDDEKQPGLLDQALSFIEDKLSDDE